MKNYYLNMFEIYFEILYLYFVNKNESIELDDIDILFQ